MFDEEGFPIPDPNRKPRTKEEIDADIDFLANHPLNAKTITPEMLETPEFQALQQLAFEGSPDEVATNFKVSFNNRV